MNTKNIKKDIDKTWEQLYTFGCVVYIVYNPLQRKECQSGKGKRDVG